MILAGYQFNERDLLERVMRQAQPVKTRGYGQYRWVWVMRRFAFGSTVARAMCEEFNLNPDDMVTK